MTKILYLIAFLFFSSSMAQTVSITFEVDMSYQQQKGVFDPANDFVDIAGTFNDWGASSSQLTDPDGDLIYATTLDGFTAGNTIEFKFRINGEWNGLEEFPGGGPNRVHTIAQGNETLSFLYSDEEPQTGPATVLDISASSDFVYTGGAITFEARTEGLIEDIQWFFEGGNPAESSEYQVTVDYSDIGTYDVSVKVSNTFSEDSFGIADLVTVSEQSTADLGWWNEEVFYEIFVRSFYDSDGDGVGDIQGIIEKLDYLNDGDPSTETDLGITGIWLMPIHESPTYHGYDVNDYRSINPDYGTMEDFRQLVQEAHDRGIKIIIDLVLNHSSTEIEWFQNALSGPDASKRDWYRWSDTNPGYAGPWGQNVWHNSATGYYYGLFWGGMPDLNYQNPDLKQEMFDITRFWLEDIGIDGYRLDAVKYIVEDGSNLEDLPETHAFWREWVGVTKQSNPNAFSVGEAWTTTSKVVPYVVQEGLDICFDFDLGYAILNSIRGEDAGPFIGQTGWALDSYPYYQFGTFTTNHDMNRLMNELWEDPEKVRLAATLYLTIPGVPFIYYGEEVGMTGVKPDENIRRPMSWSSDSYAGFSSSSPWNQPALNYRTYNVADQEGVSSSIFSHYRKLVQLRTKNTALQTGDFRFIETGTPATILFERASEENVFYTAVNLSGVESTITFSLTTSISVAEQLQLVDQLDKSNSFSIDSDRQVSISLAPYSSMVLRPEEVLSLGDSEKVLVYPNPTNDVLLVSAAGSYLVSLSTMDGKKILSRNASEDVEIDLSELESGIYLLEIRLGDHFITRRIKKD